MNNLPIGVLLLVMVTGAVGESPGDAAPPAWFSDYLQQEIGRWVADNSAYRSEKEPYEAFGVEWSYATDETSLVGRLYGSREGQPDKEFWQFRVYWHPGEQEVRIDQWGRGGSMLSGWIRPAGEEQGFRVFEVEQDIFTRSGGHVGRTRHRTVFHPEARVGESFDWKEGRWVTRRSYTWKKQ